MLRRPKKSGPSDPSTPVEWRGAGCTWTGLPFILKRRERSLLRILFCFLGSNGSVWANGSVSSGEAPGEQETLKIHYEMMAEGFLLTFGLVIENRNQ